MRRLLSRLVMPVLALLSSPAMLASLPSQPQPQNQPQNQTQSQTINVLSTDSHDCVGLTFKAARLGRHLYNVKLAALDRCANCRIQEASATIVFQPNYCQYKVKFVAAKGSERPTIRIRESEQTVLLKGHDEANIRRLFATLCSQGGVRLPVDKPIKLEQEVDGMSIEFANGMPVEITGPAPLSVWVTARDSCGRRGFAIIPINLM